MGKSFAEALILTAVCCTLLLTACKSDNPTTSTPKENVDTSTFMYPFETGNWWNYSSQVIVSNIRPDSISHYFTSYPKTGIGTVTVLDDTVINFYTARRFHETYTEDTSSYAALFYFYNFDTALVCYGYRNNIYLSFTPYSVHYGISFMFNGKSYTELKNILADYSELRTVRNIPAFNQISLDSLIIEDPPVECLKYPVLKGTEWLFKNIPNSYIIYKKYLDFENVTINGQRISCVRTQRIWAGLDDLILYDFYSKYGQMKRDYTLKDVQVKNAQGFPIGYVDYNYSYVVTSYSITK